MNDRQLDRIRALLPLQLFVLNTAKRAESTTSVVEQEWCAAPMVVTAVLVFWFVPRYGDQCQTCVRWTRNDLRVPLASTNC